MANIHESIGMDLGPLGGILRCERCNNKFPLAEGRIGGFLAHGWPKCCGSTMSWITQNALNNEKKMKAKKKRAKK